MKKSQQGKLFSYFQPVEKSYTGNGIDKSPAFKTNGVEKRSVKVEVGLLKRVETLSIRLYRVGVWKQEESC